uniref:Cytochrome P450 n=1 Tax=Elaeophora elaphi TaxID=1147741 RepID=A0A0R3RT21_9BILA
LILLGHRQHRWLIDKIILNSTKLLHSLYRLERRNSLAEHLKDKKNRSVFDGTRLLLSNLINQSENVNNSVMKKSITEFLREIIFESIIADAVFSMDLANNWIKYDFEDFKKQSQPLIAFEG